MRCFYEEGLYLFYIFCMLMETTNDFTSVSGVFMGSEEGKYYTVTSEILSPGSCYTYKENNGRKKKLIRR
jgi:hypothetical protein